MIEPGFEATLKSGDVTLTSRDIELLRAIDQTGSLSAASASLGRSYAHLQRRVVELEAAIEPLTERVRGGEGGGGTQLTRAGHRLCAQFDRLQTELTGATSVDASVFEGTVIERTGEIGVVDTDIGPITALVPETNNAVRVGIRSDAVVIDTPEGAVTADQTSRRNQFSGTVSWIDRLDSVARVGIAVDTGELIGLVTTESLDRLALSPTTAVLVSFKATAARAVPDQTVSDSGEKSV